MHHASSTARSFTPMLMTLILALVLPGMAAATTIDFEDLGFQEDITNQYAGDSVIFDNYVSAIAFVDLNEIDFPPSSGSIVARAIDTSITSSIGFTTAFREVEFALTTSGEATITFNWIGGSDVLVVGPNTGTSELVAYSNLAGITGIDIDFTSSGIDSGFVIDDLRYGAPIPEPGAAFLMMSGLVAVRAGLRRPRPLPRS